MGSGWRGGEDKLGSADITNLDLDLDLDVELDLDCTNRLGRMTERLQAQAQPCPRVALSPPLDSRQASLT